MHVACRPSTFNQRYNRRSDTKLCGAIEDCGAAAILLEPQRDIELMQTADSE
jgi:hypothetical protein